MKKHYLMVLFLFFFCGMQADEVKVLEENTFSLAISPNGKYLVGYNPTKVKSGVGTESFLYDVGSGSLKWVTTDDPEHWKTCGLFKDVNDAGTLCGSVKDLDHVIDFYGTSAPTNIAAILENGKVVKLP